MIIRQDPGLSGVCSGKSQVLDAGSLVTETSRLSEDVLFHALKAKEPASQDFIQNRLYELKLVKHLQLSLVQSSQVVVMRRAGWRLNTNARIEYARAFFDEEGVQNRLVEMR